VERIFLAIALMAAVLLIALRLWVAARIEASLSRPMICLQPRDRAKPDAGQLSARERDLWGVKSAQFGADVPAGPGFGWHAGVLIEFGYHLLWSRRGREAQFARLSRRMHHCRT